MVSTLASKPSCPKFDSLYTRSFFRGKIADVAEVNQWHSLGESEQWLDVVDQTHLVLASGKIVVQKALSHAIHSPIRVVQQ